MSSDLHGGGEGAKDSGDVSEVSLMFPLGITHRAVGWRQPEDEARRGRDVCSGGGPESGDSTVDVVFSGPAPFTSYLGSLVTPGVGGLVAPSGGG